MHSYKYTDKILLILAIGNILIIIPAVWTMWWPLSLALIPHSSSMAGWVTTLLMYAVLAIAIYCISALVFLKRWRIALFIYIYYLAVFQIPKSIYILYLYWKNGDKGLAYIDSKIYSWSGIILFIVALLALITLFLETDYTSLKMKWQQHLFGQK